MPGVQLTCPHCGARLNFGEAIPPGAALRCLMCDKTFSVQAPTAAVSAAAPSASASRNGKGPVAAPPARSIAPRTTSALPAPAMATPARAKSSRFVGGLVLTFLALALLGGLSLLVWRASRSGGAKTVEPDPEPLAQVHQPSPPPAKVDDVPKAPAEAATKKKSDPVVADPGVTEPGGVDLADVAKPIKPPAPPPLIDIAPRPPLDEPSGPKAPPTPVVPVIVPPAVIAPGIDADAVNRAIALGVGFLKAKQENTGTWMGATPNFPVGHAALGGLALLECGVPANDSAVVKAASFVRSHVQNVGTIAQNYEISTSILFLDRLGDPADHELIQLLAYRILNDQQQRNGGWGYEASIISADTAQSLHKHLQTHWPWSHAKPRPAGKFDPKDPKASLPLATVDLRKLSPQQLVWNPTRTIFSATDNSNTQFAMLALWAARRHGVAVECPLLLSYQRFMTTQNQDGGWGYVMSTAPLMPMPPPGGQPPGLPFNPPPGMQPPQPGLPPMKPMPGLPAPQPGMAPFKPMPGDMPPAGPGGGVPPPPVMGGMAEVMNSRPTMTCVGLLGLALGHGVVQEPKDAPKNKAADSAIQKGLAQLAREVGTPVADPTAQPVMQNLYLLWSIERVAVLYDLKTIGGKDWYGWGAQILLRNQNLSGSWMNGQYQGSCESLDTVFALLFLKRSNLVREATENIRLRMVIRDPGAR